MRATRGDGMKKKVLGYDPNFKFSEDQREALWRIIRQKFGPKKAILLTDSLEFICKIQSWREKRDEKVHRSMLTVMLRNLKQTEKHLEMLGGYDENKEPSFVAINPGPLRGIMDITAFKGITISSNPKNFDINFSSRNLSVKILPSLNNLIENLEYALKHQPAKPGAPKGSLPFFIRLVADDYQAKLGEKPKNGGLFLKLIQRLLFVLKLPSDNPRRAVREALKNLN